MFIYQLPTKIEFGCGVSGGLGRLAEGYGDKAVIVTDRKLVNLPFFQRIAGDFNKAAVFSEVGENPTVRNVDALTGFIRANAFNLIVAVGGGSSLDCAKAASALAPAEGESIREYHTGGKKFGGTHWPLIAVPTTAGTGSEVTPFAVLDDTEKNIKGPMASDSFYPVCAVVDPELTVSLPLKVTAATAMDALCHAIEGYWSRNHQPICDLFAREAARQIFLNLENVLKNPADINGRTALSYAALTAGMAFQLPKNAVVHACSFPLSARYHMPHGVACAFTLEGAIELNAPYMDGRMEAFCYYCGFGSIAEMTAVVKRLKKLGGLPLNLKEAGIDESQIAILVEESFHPLIKNNPKEVEKKDLFAIYEKLKQG